MSTAEPVGDDALLGRIVARDQLALAELFRRYAPSVLALARRILHDPMLAEDVVQEAFLSVWERPNVYQPERGTVRAFLFVIVHHRAVDRIRREATQQRRIQAEADYGLGFAPSTDETVSEAVDLRDRREQVRAALVGIPSEQRRVIEMMYFDGLTQRQVATMLDLPLGTVKSRTLLAMRKLHIALAELRECSP